MENNEGTETHRLRNYYRFWRSAENPEGVSLFYFI